MKHVACLPILRVTRQSFLGFAHAPVKYLPRSAARGNESRLVGVVFTAITLGACDTISSLFDEEDDDPFEGQRVRFLRSTPCLRRTHAFKI